MDPVEVSKRAYLRAQASILRSSELSVRDASQLLRKSERWVKKWSARKDFDDKLRALAGRPAVFGGSAKTLIEKAR